MYVKVGNFQFAPHEATFSGVEIKSDHTPRGLRSTVTITMHVEGEICVPSSVPPGQEQQHITNRLAQIISATSQDFVDVGLYHDDGTPTVHYLPNNDPYNLSGNQFIYWRWPETKEGEYITGRRFAFGVRAVVQHSYSEILEYQDNLRFIGSGGPEYEWRKSPVYGYYPVLVSPSSMQTVMHYGRAVGVSVRPSAPSPFFLPPFERSRSRVIEKQGFKRLGQSYMFPETKWSYVYDLPVPNTLIAPTKV